MHSWHEMHKANSFCSYVSSEITKCILMKFGIGVYAEGCQANLILVCTVQLKHLYLKKWVIRNFSEAAAFHRESWHGVKF